MQNAPYSCMRANDDGTKLIHVIRCRFFQVLPEVYIEELSQCQDQVPFKKSQETSSTIEEELGGKISSIFEYFNPRPLACASIAQVRFDLAGERRKSASAFPYRHVFEVTHFSANHQYGSFPRASVSSFLLGSRSCL